MNDYSKINKIKNYKAKRQKKKKSSYTFKFI